MTLTFRDFFQQTTGYPPYPYQETLAVHPWPDLLDIPTGLGKTAAVVVAWLYKRLREDPETPRRLVFCLPMRVLVEQTFRNVDAWLRHSAEAFAGAGLAAPTLHRLMGGDIDVDWVERPESPAILIGTQDMLLSRALMRGYAMSRYQWPMHFALLHNDSLWVFDEVQLMGAGLATSAQLEAFRRILGSVMQSRSLWVSATLNPSWLNTVDFKPYAGALRGQSLALDDIAHPAVHQRLNASKSVGAAKTTLSAGDLLLRADHMLEQYRSGAIRAVTTKTAAQAEKLREALQTRGGASVNVLRATDSWELAKLSVTAGTKLIVDEEKALSKYDIPSDQIMSVDGVKVDYASCLAKEVIDAHRPATPTLVVLNQVGRAQALFGALQKQLGEGAELLLVHARFRPAERLALEARLRDEVPPGGRIIVATQAIEAGVDISSATLFTELAPWSSLVQRFGRCNRAGEYAETSVYWIDINGEASLQLPYDDASLGNARGRLMSLASASPAALGPTCEEAPLTSVLRRRDLLELFNTDPDVSGFDIDVSPYIRDADDTQTQVFWREVGTEPGAAPLPERSELCTVTLPQLRRYLEKKLNKQPRLAWSWDSLAGRWNRLDAKRLRPGLVVLLRASDGGYSPVLGFVPDHSESVPVIHASPRALEETYDSDWRSQQSRFVALSQHLCDVEDEAAALCDALGERHYRNPIARAARWHDLGKGHAAFQNMLLLDAPDAASRQNVLWAKSAGGGRPEYAVCAGEPPRVERRLHFRHELASALAWLAHDQESPDRDLIAYLIAAHHGKVRMGLRALPGEREPPDARRFARGIWEGDTLPALAIADREEVPEIRLRLDVMALGESGQGASWLSRTRHLLDYHGPFRLAWLETLVRIADWRASARYRQRETVR